VALLGNSDAMIGSTNADRHRTDYLAVDRAAAAPDAVAAALAELRGVPGAAWPK
jgi:hypothetical protein